MYFRVPRLTATVCLALAFGWPAVGQQAQTIAGGNPALPLVHVENGENSTAAQKAHYVVLVSLDGFRWDYAKHDGAVNLLALGKKGVWAPQGMMPSFPSLTFPNHFTIVTGLYPEHHGLVANTFYDETKHARYAISDARVVRDGSWYSGVPLWSLAESQGMHAACLFWPGSEAEIAGHRPSWYALFDNKTQATDDVEKARIDDAVALLKMPAPDRPHFITIYYSEPDHEGHEFGPDAKETKAAALKMDAMVGRLKKALDATKLPIDLVVVSDHGMTKVEGGWVNLEDFADLSNFEVAGPLLYGKTEEDRASAYNKLKQASSQFVAYRRRDVPAELEYNQNPREGDPVVIATGPYAIRARKPPAERPDNAPEAGMHGFDPHKVPEMKASFFAAGPDIVAGKTVGSFENVNLYPWIAHMLGLQVPKNDGNLNILAGTLRDNGRETANADKSTQE
ncbi:ectonucleotide pyrophosphatase/phosphodiesterase [Telmatobacter sp. DSM 110680]|uniref:Ectonucleotide pyrophosphatase/phosphodiesterase n=1 Tax=Telmatobacter sp. DSM 110680 TaxID=3036704 RepID=A0AAU7DGQ1_9BACT